MSKTIGSLGEELVGYWLESQGWQILHHQWYCRFGEIDLIALYRGQGTVPMLSFVEVKTRSQRNWDQGGLLAITPGKQAKLIQAAELFLSDRPDLSEYPCRFDVALVRCDRSPTQTPICEDIPPFPDSIKVGQPFFLNGYRLLLQDYIESAFN
ncbi:YraN family protein [Planktothrix sp. FACHB-1365]|uniref:YraN family protein n=1 Tax=Planktothrix sp. FACHB-1365 TaxID=2692855 RepID=UPI001684FAE5|nr:YraN family protein [Planktothrix sp. FACHB-1365]MBD2480995.1 YraN family protein [Planktothrix sp. FACHB-1365]